MKYSLLFVDDFGEGGLVFLFYTDAFWQFRQLILLQKLMFNHYGNPIFYSGGDSRSNFAAHAPKQTSIVRTRLHVYLSFMEVVKRMTREYAVKYGFDKQLKEVHVSFRGRHQLGFGNSYHSTYLGTCTYAIGVININPAMILMIPNRTKETLLHELCHFEVHGHSKKFYLLLDELMRREQLSRSNMPYPYLLMGRRSEEFMWMIKEVYDYYKKKKRKEARAAAKLATTI